MFKQTRSIFILHFSIIIFIVFVFYLLIATVGTFDFKLNENYTNGYYSSRTEGYLKGQLHLPINPHPELFKLKDIYDPVQNKKYREHDLSFYKGKYYLYFGATPTFVLLLPYRFITGRNLPDSFTVFVFSFGSFIFSLLILLYLKNRYFNNINSKMVLISAGVLGFGNFATWLLRRPDMYEIAISSGLFFLTGAIYFLCKAFEKSKPQIFHLMIGSTFLGLGVDCRPQIALAGIILFIALYKFFKCENILNKRVFASISTLLPFLLCCFLVLFHNYIRFDNPLEFGTKYQLAGYKIVDGFNIENAHTSLYCLFLSSPKIFSSFPFIEPKIPSVPIAFKPKSTFIVEAMVGILPGNPFILLIFFIPLIYLIYKIRFQDVNLNKVKFPIFEFTMILVPAILHILIILTRSGIGLRYLADFSTLLILVAIIMWFYFIEIIPSLKTKSLINYSALIFATLSIYFGIAFPFGF